MREMVGQILQRRAGGAKQQGNASGNDDYAAAATTVTTSTGRSAPHQSPKRASCRQSDLCPDWQMVRRLARQGGFVHARLGNRDVFGDDDAVEGEDRHRGM